MPIHSSSGLSLVCNSRRFQRGCFLFLHQFPAICYIGNYHPRAPIDLPIVHKQEDNIHIRFAMLARGYNSFEMMTCSWWNRASLVSAIWTTRTCQMSVTSFECAWFIHHRLKCAAVKQWRHVVCELLSMMWLYDKYIETVMLSPTIHDWIQRTRIHQYPGMMCCNRECHSKQGYQQCMPRQVCRQVTLLSQGL